MKTIIQYIEFSDLLLLQNESYIKEKLKEWDKLGYKIILISSERNSKLEAVKSALASSGVFYDDLIMDCRGSIELTHDDYSIVDYSAHKWMSAKISVVEDSD